MDGHKSADDQAQSAHRLANEMILYKSTAALMQNKVWVCADLSVWKTKESTLTEPAANGPL